MRLSKGLWGGAEALSTLHGVPYIHMLGRTLLHGTVNGCMPS